MVDIYAIQSIYGSTSTRTGDTIYGFNSNAGSIYDFSQYWIKAQMLAPGATIYDSGGSDTLDCSGYSVNQIIDLNPGHWSSLGGAVNNIGIYLTTNIENAIGGTGDDVFISNGSLIGTLTGGGGNDTFKATQAGLNLYTISDLSFGDKINFTDASFASFNYTFDGTALRYEGNTIWVSNNPHGAFQVSADTISRWT